MGANVCDAVREEGGGCACVRVCVYGATCMDDILTSANLGNFNQSAGQHFHVLLVTHLIFFERKRGCTWAGIFPQLLEREAGAGDAASVDLGFYFQIVGSSPPPSSSFGPGSVAIGGIVHVVIGLKSSITKRTVRIKLVPLCMVSMKVVQLKKTQLRVVVKVLWETRALVRNHGRCEKG